MFLEDGLFDNPIDKLAKYLKVVAIQVGSNILDEAEKIKQTYVKTD